MKIHLYKDHQALESLIKRNQCKKQYSARLTRWLDRIKHFDKSIQYKAGSNLNFTDYLSRNPVGGATQEENYDEEYVINVLAEQAELNLKYGPLLADQSKHTVNKTNYITTEPRHKLSKKKNNHKRIEHSRTHKT